MVDQTKIGDKIRKAREDLGMTQEVLGKMVGVTAMGISYMEKGLRKLKVEDIVKIAEKLGVESSYLLEPVTGQSVNTNNSASAFNFRSDFELGGQEKKEIEKKINDAFNDLFKDE